MIYFTGINMSMSIKAVKKPLQKPPSKLVFSFLVNNEEPGRNVQIIF